jgi:DNA-binding CsgD family transcriptional regulator
LTLNALGPKPGPPAAIIAKTFRLTPSEAKLACIIARGAPPDVAVRELKISRETARNQLKSIFAKTATHRQSELVALLLQVDGDNPPSKRRNPPEEPEFVIQPRSGPPPKPLSAGAALPLPPEQDRFLSLSQK